MDLKELQQEDGDVVYVDPSDVVGIQRRDTLVSCSRIYRRSTPNPVDVLGAPREVAQKLATPSDALSRGTVVQALTTEYRMALGWDGMGEVDAARFHSVRVALLKVANAIGVVLDEVLINTPL